MRHKFRQKRFFIYFGAALLAITVFTVVGKNGLIDAYGFKKERDRISELNRTVEEENKRLTEEIRLFKTDRRYVANLAREGLGMLGKDEVIYNIEKEEKK
ncbi:MAG: septum formation initiator family protein [Deltaproteobacteria bacterium]|nr:septum formation initiator family protein [Deltaproteobacteria bacterium]